MGIVFDYCPEGYLNLQRFFPNQAVGIFIMAPDIDTMKKRLQQRGTESEEEQLLIYDMALRDFNFVNQHQYYIVNQDFSEALAKLRAIQIAEKSKLARQPRVFEAYAEYSKPTLLRYYAPSATECNNT